MKDLKIGQPVRVKAVTEVGYHKEDGYRDPRRSVLRSELDFSAVVTGRCIKHLGRILAGWRGFGDEYEPSQLKITGVVELWEVRTGMLNKPILVADGDLEPGPEFDFPRMSRKRT